jgi:hypothetical protein
VRGDVLQCVDQEGDRGDLLVRTLRQRLADDGIANQEVIRFAEQLPDARAGDGIDQGECFFGKRDVGSDERHVVCTPV